MKTLIAILLVLITSSCCTPSTQYKYIGSKIIIPPHQKLDALTEEEVNSLPPVVKSKFENIKAALIGNIKQLEHNITVHNNDIEEQER